MDFAASVAVIGRRWWVALAAFLATLAATGLVYSSIPKEYVSTAVLGSDDADYGRHGGR